MEGNARMGLLAMEGKKLLRPRLNFITIHYLYMIAIILLGTFLMYPVKNMRYIDVLFFSSGSATQAGLNTVDVNKIALYQQIVLYVQAMVTNPIFINTAVVFVRLHWFEKRFKHIVAMSRQPSKARTLSKAVGDRGPESAEMGVRGREIKVLHPTRRTSSAGKFEVVEGPDGMIMRRKPSASPQTQTPIPEQQQGERRERPESPERPGRRSRSISPGSSSTATEPTGRPSPGGNSPPPTGHSTSNTGIQFVNLPTPNKKEEPVDRDRDASPHITFGKNTRPRALRIPSPLAYDKGDRPEDVDEDDAYTLNQTGTNDDDRSREPGSAPPRSWSMSRVATNASNTLRMRKLPSVDRVLPHVATMASAAFSVGPTRRRTGISPFSGRTESRQKEVDVPYLSFQPTIGRNSQFVDLTEEQRDELGGIEYRSLKLLAKILIAYYVGWHIFAVLATLPWIYNAPHYLAYVESCGINGAWWAFFTAQTAFNDVGFTLTPDSMMSFQKATWIILSLTFLIIIGNTGFPCLLRFIVWVMFKLSPKDSGIQECLKFLLDHPRRCFTLLFPGKETWVLFGILFALNITDVILFIILDLNDDAVSSIPVGNRIAVAFFQAASTRTAGTSAVNVAALHPAIQVSYLIMMYISVFPIAISVRRTNVYEERSLGMFEDDEDEEGNGSPSFIGTHLRKQLSFDLWYIFLGLFVISIVEGPRLQDPNDYYFSLFAVLFEIVSAYGTVGLSLGYPTINASFSGELGVISKLVIIAMQIRGRHRGLPYELDRAVLLPSDKRDHQLSQMPRRMSTMTTATASGAQMASPPSMGRPYSQRVPSQAIEDD